MRTRPPARTGAGLFRAGSRETVRQGAFVLVEVLVSVLHARETGARRGARRPKGGRR